ncbi:MAG: hydroxymethylglutaryl-CoA lyase [Deltaproteobacteria bacterium]|nr:hydroxymethylglutaryl-CoA lyase [Deltaproteobacteria bacterium]
MAEITIVECAPRDGLKMGEGIIPLDEKVSFIEKLSETGINKIEAVSFIHPRLLPQLGDAEQVMKSITKKPGVTYIGVTPTEVACRRAILTDIDNIMVLIAASETFNQVALGYSLREMINKVLPSIINVALSEGKGIRAYILTSFGCPYEGKVEVNKVEELVSKLDFMRVNEISLIDSTGMADPMHVKALLSYLLKLKLKAKLAVHFHETRGMGLANAMAAFEAGVRIFDTAVGGMSTKPFGAPDHSVTTWNIPTEDLVNMFESMGIQTGIDLDVLLACASMAERMMKRQLSSHILRAGPSHRVFQPPQKLKIG